MALKTYYAKDYLGRPLVNDNPGNTVNPTDYLGRLIVDPDDPDNRSNVNETDYLGRELTDNQD